MNGPVAQLAALTCHANAFLGGREIPRFFPGNSTCQFCQRIEFVELEATPAGEPARRVLAVSPDEWIHELPVREVDGCLLSFAPRNDPEISDRLSAGFVGGGHVWQILVLRDDGLTERWSSDWGVIDRNAPDRRLWGVDYRRDAIEPRTAYRGRNLAVVRQSFHDRLIDIRTFSLRHTEGTFTSHFDEALLALENPEADVGYHKDIAVPGQLGATAQSLLKASMRAWVFGGMGSWNDMGFARPLQTEYENLSDGLFEVLHEAIEAAVSSTYLAS
jgi:hypothetical protein